MANELVHTSRSLPVVVGYDYQRVVAKADIFRSPEKVLIQIASENKDGQALAELLEQDTPIALSIIFVATPVRNSKEKRDTN